MKIMFFCNVILYKLNISVNQISLLELLLAKIKLI